MTAKTPVEVSWPHLAAAFALGALCHAAAVPVLRRLVRLRPSFNRTPKAVKNTVALNASEPMRKVVCFDNAARLEGGVLHHTLYMIPHHGSMGATMIKMIQNRPKNISSMKTQ